MNLKFCRHWVMVGFFFIGYFHLPLALSQQISEDGNRRDAAKEWKSLFNGTDFSGWEVSLFGGDGEIVVKQGEVEIGLGHPMSGLRYLGEIPKQNFEIRLEAKRIAGNDFFCGLTFPVHDSYCSLIVGGWGGTVVGLSNIDGLDASENESTCYLPLKSNRWYRVRVRVMVERIDVWLDGKQVIRQDIRNRKLTLRNEMLATRPFGLATWRTKALLRKIRIQSMD